MKRLRRKRAPSRGGPTRPGAQRAVCASTGIRRGRTDTTDWVARGGGRGCGGGRDERERGQVGGYGGGHG